MACNPGETELECRVRLWADERVNFLAMTNTMFGGNVGYCCPSCWDWPEVYTCAGKICVKDPTGMGGFTKSDCGGKCRLSTRHQVLDDSPLWEKRADDFMLAAVPDKCSLRKDTGFNIKCLGQIGSPSAYGAIYQVKLPKFDTLARPIKTLSATSIVGKCMMADATNPKEQRLAKAASELVAGNVCPNFPLLIGAIAGCSVPVRESHPAARRSKKLGIPLPQVRDVMFSELAAQDLIMWTKSFHSAQEWKKVYFQVFYAIEYMQYSLKIIHNDLHGGNVLLTAGGTAIIHDFGKSYEIGSGLNFEDVSGTMYPPCNSWDRCPAWRFIDYKRACGMSGWAGTLPPGGYGGVAAPAEIKAIFEECRTEMKRAFMFVAYTDEAAVACTRRMRDLWNPNRGLYRSPQYHTRISLGDAACSNACETDGVLDPDTLQCSIDQTMYPGVKCCQASAYTGCACAGTEQCVEPMYPVEPSFTLKLIKADGTGTLDVGVTYWANQTILVCLHPDAQPAKFQFVPNEAAGTFYLQIFQTAFGPSQFPPPERNAPDGTPLYVRNAPPTYAGEQESYTYVTTNKADATQFKVETVDEETGKFKLSVVIQRTPTYSQTLYLRSDDGGNSLVLGPSASASTWQAVLD